MPTPNLREEPNDADERERQIEALNLYKKNQRDGRNLRKKRDLSQVESHRDTPEYKFYARMRHIMKKPRDKLSLLDKQQMFEIVDKTMNSVHLIDIDKECKQEIERIGFDNYIKDTHDYIEQRRRVILTEQRAQVQQRRRQMHQATLA